MQGRPHRGHKGGKNMRRRDFLKSSTIGAAGAGVLGSGSIAMAETSKKDSVPKIKEYRTLGRTGFKVSDISAGIIPQEALLNAMLDAGVNYIDTASLYLNGQHEKIIGKALKNRDRKKFFITSKLVVTPFAAKMTGIKDISKEAIIKRFYQSLERLQTDYLDCLMMYAEKADTLKIEAFHAAVKQLKAEGKLKFVGVSNHGAFSPYIASGESMRDVLLKAAEDGRFDVFMIAYNYLNRKHGDEVLKVCKKKGIGVTLMKTNPVGNYFGVKQGIAQLEKAGKKVPEYSKMALARLKKQYEQSESFLKKHNLEDPGEIKDAAIKFCLNNPNVNSVVLSVRNFDQVTQYVKLSGTKLTPVDAKALKVYSKSMGELYCRHACGECEGKCPRGVPVNTIMRYNHYFAAQGREKYAMRQYAELPSKVADQCHNCTGNCETACPYNIPIQTLLQLAHQNLTLA